MTSYNHELFVADKGMAEIEAKIVAQGDKIRELKAAKASKDAIQPEVNSWLFFFLLMSTFLSDPSPIIGYACHSLTHSLTHSRLVNLIDVTLACEDGNSKLVEDVTVANVDDEDRVGNSLLQIWELRFGHKAKLLFIYFEHKAWSRF